MNSVVSTENHTSSPPPAWSGFKTGLWQATINVRDFIQLNYKPYDGGGGFLMGSSQKTRAVWEQVSRLLELERDNGGVLAISSKIPSTITSHQPGYIDKENETIVGL
jgi:formate C-acetyltransferase